MIAILLALLLAAGCTCRDEPEPQGPSLAEVSTRVQFGAVEALGPHRYVANTVRVERRGGDEVSRSESGVVLVWKDWDHFALRRLVDGRVVSAVRVVGGRAWVRRGPGRWNRKEDAEPWRTHVRTTWSAWDEALELFRDRIGFVEDGREVVEGRPARRYLVVLDEAQPAEAMREAAEGGPVSLAGTVWVDEATAVRLKADVMGTWRRDEVERQVHFTMRRSGIGRDFRIRRPGKGKLRPGRRRRRRVRAPETREAPGGGTPSPAGAGTPPAAEEPGGAESAAGPGAGEEG